MAAEHTHSYMAPTVTETLEKTYLEGNMAVTKVAITP